jgi:hypothetical protein
MRRRTGSGAEDTSATGAGKRASRAAACVLPQHLRQVGLAGTELAEAQATTIRTKLLKIGGLLKRSARRIILHPAEVSGRRISLRSKPSRSGCTWPFNPIQ